MLLLLPPPLKLTDINSYPIHIVHYNIRTWHFGTVVVNSNKTDATKYYFQNIFKFFSFNYNYNNNSSNNNNNKNMKIPSYFSTKEDEITFFFLFHLSSIIQITLKIERL